MLKKFAATIFAAALFVNSISQAAAEDLLLEDPLAETDYEELPGEYKTPPEYEDDEKPPETVETPPHFEGEGLEFHVYHKNGVMAFAIIADHERYNLQPVLAKNQIHGRATVSQMTKNFDDIAMINAGYFMTNGSLIGVTKIDGEIIGKDDFYLPFRCRN